MRARLQQDLGHYSGKFYFFNMLHKIRYGNGKIDRGFEGAAGSDR